MPAPQNPFPLDIASKQDTWDKQQLLKHIDSSLQLTADEINKIIAALEYLYGNSGVSGDIIGNIPTKLRYINIDHDAPGSTITKIVNAVNNGPQQVLENGAIQWFYTSRAVLTNGSGIRASVDSVYYAIITEYFVLSQKIPAVSGGVSMLGNGGSQITTASLVSLPLKDSRNFAPQEFDLGNIGIMPIHTAVNTTGPRSTPNTSTIIFRAEQNGTEKVWLYIGQQENTGIGFPEVAPSSFRELTADGSGADPEPPGNTITKSSKNYKNFLIVSTSPQVLFLSSEITTYNLTKAINPGVTNQVIGFSTLEISQGENQAGTPVFDGMDIYIRSDSVEDIILKNNDGAVEVPFNFTEGDLTISNGQIVHLKLNKTNNRVELVGVASGGASGGGGLYTIPQSGTDIGKLDLSNPLGLDATTNINEVESLSIHTGSVVGGNLTFRSRTMLRPTIAGATEQEYLSEPSANFDNTATYTIVVWKEANKINWLMRKRS